MRKHPGWSTNTPTAQALGETVLRIFSEGGFLLMGDSRSPIVAPGDLERVADEYLEHRRACIDQNVTYTSGDLRRAMEADAHNDAKNREEAISVRTTGPTPGQLARDQTLAWSFSPDIADEDGLSEVERVFGRPKEKAKKLEGFEWFLFCNYEGLKERVLIPTIVADELRTRGIKVPGAKSGVTAFAIASCHPTRLVSSYARHGTVRWGQWTGQIPLSMHKEHMKVASIAHTARRTQDFTAYQDAMEPYLLQLLEAKGGVPKGTPAEFVADILLERGEACLAECEL